ncbi:MAG: Rab family GTPase [Thermoplasmata archaeon]
MPDLGNGPRVKLKVCAVGEEAVGKTSLIGRFMGDVFAEDYVRTLGTLINKKTVEVERPAGAPVAVEVVIWDIMGFPGFMQLLRDAYFYKARGVFAVLDLTRRETLEGLHAWLRGMYDAVGPQPVVILANKADLDEEREVSQADVATLSETYDAPYYVTSAKTGNGLAEGFEALIELTLERWEILRDVSLEEEATVMDPETSHLSMVSERPHGRR